MTTAEGRKIVYVLGAGASRGAKAVAKVQHGGNVQIPIQADFWPTYLKFSRKEKRKQIESFLYRYFTKYGKVPGRLKDQERWQRLKSIDVEEVFTFLSERLNSSAISPQAKSSLEEINQILISELVSVFNRFPANKDTKKIYRRLLKSQIRSRDTIVSFNYDTVFEGSIPQKRWCYEGLQNSSKKIGILKPHGSINWELTEKKVKVLHGNSIRKNASPLVVAPTHLKFVGMGGQSKIALSDDIIGVWRCLEKELREAKAIVFVGYSFPLADLFFSSILRMILGNAGARPKIMLVNPDAVNIRHRLKIRFEFEAACFFDLEQFSQISRSRLLESQ